MHFLSKIDRTGTKKKDAANAPELITVTLIGIPRTCMYDYIEFAD